MERVTLINAQKRQYFPQLYFIFEKAFPRSRIEEKNGGFERFREVLKRQIKNFDFLFKKRLTIPFSSAIINHVANKGKLCPKIGAFQV